MPKSACTSKQTNNQENMKGAFIIREVKGGYSLNYRMPDGVLEFKPFVYPDFESVMEMAEFLATLDELEQWTLTCRYGSQDHYISRLVDDRRTLFAGRNKYSARKAWARIEAMCASFADAETIVLKKGQRMPRKPEQS